MKRILLGILGVMGIVGMMGCDKIEQGEYTIYDGATVSWTSSATTVVPVQRVLVEKFTGPRCNNCPKADVTLASVHNDNVVMIAINHPSGQGEPYPGQPDMRTDGGTVWDLWYGIGPIPAAYINRNTGTQYLGEMSNIVGDINQALAATPTVALDILSSATGNNVQVTVNLQYVIDYTQPVTLTVALVEDSLRYSQLLPDYTVDDNYAHNHILRKVVTSYWGANVSASGHQGESLQGSLSFSVSNDIVLENSHIVAFISDKASRKVLNSASCRIDN